MSTQYTIELSDEQGLICTRTVTIDGWNVTNSEEYAVPPVEAYERLVAKMQSGEPVRTVEKMMGPGICRMFGSRRKVTQLFMRGGLIKGMDIMLQGDE
jgi:hypothetical protein